MGIAKIEQFVFVSQIVMALSTLGLDLQNDINNDIKLNGLYKYKH